MLGHSLTTIIIFAKRIVYCTVRTLHRVRTVPICSARNLTYSSIDSITTSDVVLQMLTSTLVINIKLIRDYSKLRTVCCQINLYRSFFKYCMTTEVLQYDCIIELVVY